MGDHKSKLHDNRDHSSGENAAQDCSTGEILPSKSVNEPGLPQTESLSPALESLGTALPWRLGKMPEEGADLFRTGFALASLMLGAWALVGSLISTWALIPAALAIIFAPAGIVSTQRRRALFGLILGIAAFAIVGMWGPYLY